MSSYRGRKTLTQSVNHSAMMWDKLWEMLIIVSPLSYSKTVIIRTFSETNWFNLIRISSNATNLHHLTSRSSRLAPQHRDRIATIDHYVTSLHPVLLILNANVLLPVSILGWTIFIFRAYIKAKVIIGTLHGLLYLVHVTIGFARYWM